MKNIIENNEELILTKINNKENLIVIDPDKELSNKYKNILNDNNYNVFNIDFTDANNSQSWNPLMYPYTLYKEGNKDKSLELIQDIADSIFKENDPMDPFWGNATADLFTGLAIGLLIDGDETKININTIEKMVRDFEVNKDTLKTYIESKGKDSVVYKLAECAVFAPQDTVEGIILVFKQKIGLYTLRENINKVIINNSLDLSKIKNDLSAIFITCSIDSEPINKLVNILDKQLN